MVQPQHTLNDLYTGLGCLGGGCLGGGHDSIYEKNIGARTLQPSFFLMREGSTVSTSTAVTKTMSQSEIDFGAAYPKPATPYRFQDFLSTASGNTNARGFESANLTLDTCTQANGLTIKVQDSPTAAYGRQ